MQPADPWKADDGRRRGRARLDGASQRSVLAEPEMRAITAVVVDQRIEQAVQVALVRTMTWSSSCRRTVPTMRSATHSANSEPGAARSPASLPYVSRTQGERGSVGKRIAIRSARHEGRNDRMAWTVAWLSFTHCKFQSLYLVLASAGLVPAIEPGRGAGLSADTTAATSAACAKSSSASATSPRATTSTAIRPTASRYAASAVTSAARPASLSAVGACEGASSGSVEPRSGERRASSGGVSS